MRNKLIIIASLTLGLLGLGAGIAYASIPGSDGVIHGCYKNTNPAMGALTVIDSAATCPSGTTSLNWNQTGPQGPQGATGATGATGPQGPAGPQATAQDVTSQVTYSNLPAFPNGAEVDPVLNCPAGTLAINGGISNEQPLPPDPGFTISNNGSAVEQFAQNLPRPVNSGASWQLSVAASEGIEVDNLNRGTPQPITVTYYVICE